MCIIVVKPIGLDLPNEETLWNCFFNNPDGIGFMFSENHMVFGVKGSFDFDEFWKNVIEIDIDWVNIPAVFHFRIATSG